MKITTTFPILFFSLFYHFTLYAQSGRNIQYNCTYATLFNLDFDRGNDMREFDGKLIIRNEKSFFYMLATKNTYQKEDDDQNITVKIDSLFKVVKNETEDFLFFSDILFSKKEAFYKDSLHKMKWELSKERKFIDSIECFKAITFFRGRSYTAWFAPGIPITNGPWKMGGLPGLVVELYDEKKDIYFVLKEVVKTDDNSGKDKIPNINSHLLYADYLETGKKFIKKFTDAMKTQEVGCLTCQTKSKVKFYFWETVFE